MDQPALTVTGLRTEYLVNPIGIDVPRPRLSWRLESSRRNQAQSAWQVLVASSADRLARDDGGLWDSGRVEGRESAHIHYGGAPLASRQGAWWKVRVWDSSGEPSAWSEVATWEVGLLKATDWQGRWASLPGIAPDRSIPEAAELDALLPVTRLRREFVVGRDVSRARLYVTARGIYEARLNGETVGEETLAPGWTDYHKRIQYQVYDVNGMLADGPNILAAEVATGWYAGYVGWQNLCRHYGDTPQLLAQLHLDYAAGSSEVVATDRQWLAATGPTRYSDFLMGEYHDARVETPGWDRAGFDAPGWVPVELAAPSAVPLVASRAEPIRALESIAPIAITEPTPGTYNFDLGQNIAGRARLKVNGPPGTTVRLRHAEILNPDGTLYLTNLRSARATDTAILSGDGEEVFEPRFTWHGFRYVEVTGLPDKPDTSTITGRFVGSDTRPAGDFRCSDELVNQLQRNIVWGQRGNFLSIPTDCPQRDERLGWLGDAQVFIATAVGNMDVAAFFTKWMFDVVDAQAPNGAFPDVAPRAVDLATGAPAWADCGVIVPWTIWKTYGDTGIIDQHWHAMERYMAWLDQGNPDRLWRHDRGNDFGDWLSIAADTPKELIGTAYWAYDARLMAEMANATGRTADAERYAGLHDEIAAAFRGAYLSPEGTIEGETQTALCLALHFGLLEEGQRQGALDRLVADIEAKGNHLSTGFVGVSYLCHVLTANGRPDVAYRLLHQETFPGWKYSIRHGATTIWERWDGWTEDKGFQDPGMNSFNHYSLGSVGEWLRKSVAGIDQPAGEAGHGHALIHPVLDDTLDWAEGTCDSIRGPIRSRWERSGDGVTYRIQLPANVRATVDLDAPAGTTVTESGNPPAAVEGLTVLNDRDGRYVAEIGSGSWKFQVS
jgi:alpha-L-rhamnosidase